MQPLTRIPNLYHFYFHWSNGENENKCIPGDASQTIYCEYFHKTHKYVLTFKICAEGFTVHQQRVPPKLLIGLVHKNNTLNTSLGLSVHNVKIYIQSKIELLHLCIATCMSLEKSKDQNFFTLFKFGCESCWIKIMCLISIVTCACTNIWSYHSTQNLENIFQSFIYDEH